MLKTGILNPHLLSLLARVRHTNTLVIADRGFPSWSGMEIIDLSLVNDVPTVLQVLTAVKENFVMAHAYMAEEFTQHNGLEPREAVERALAGVPLSFEAHDLFKKRIPSATGLIRTGDTIQYANMVLVSG